MSIHEIDEKKVPRDRIVSPLGVKSAWLYHDTDDRWRRLNYPTKEAWMDVRRLKNRRKHKKEFKKW